MRAELEQVQEIERYLLDEMSAPERAEFESKLSENTRLKEEVEAQKTVMQAIKRVGLKTVAISAYTAWIIRKWLLRGAVTVGIVGGAFVAYHFMTQEEDCVPCEGKTEVHVEGTDSAIPATDENCCDEPYEIYSEETIPHSADTICIEEIDTVSTSLLEDAIQEESVDDNGNSNSSNDVNEEVDYRMEPGTYTPNDEILNSLWKENDKANGQVDVEPEFPGGQTGLQNYLVNEMNYPEGAISRNIQE